MFSLTLFNREWSTTDVKTDIVFSFVRIPSFIPHALYPNVWNFRWSNGRHPTTSQNLRSPAFAVGVQKPLLDD